MTVSSPVNSVTYTGNSATTIFSYAFEIRVAENAVVVLTDITDPSNPIAVELVAAQYTLTGVGDEAGGTVTYPLVGSPITTNQRITIQSIEPFTQEVDIVNQDGFYPAVVERALDKLTRMCQQLNEQFSRAVLVPIGSTQTIDLSSLIDAINTAAAALAGATGVLTPCTATGTNTIALTPVSGGAHAVYINQELFSFVAANTTTGVVTANVSGLGPKKIYLETGVQASTDDIVIGVLYLLSYVAALDSAVGGFYLLGTAPVPYTRFPEQAQATILGRASGAGTGVPSALTGAQVSAIITAPTVKVFSVSGTYTKPADVKAVIVECVGGGGGGGYGNSDAAESAGGSGGGAGGYARKLIVAASLGATETVTIGAAGTGGVASTTTQAAAGGTTSFGAHCAASGGSAGVSSISSVTAALAAGGVSGGIGSSGDINAKGGGSLHGFRFNGTLFLSGKGGDSIWGAGGVAVQDAVGGAGTGFGGGGSGASSVNNTDRNGGAGSAGYVIVTEFY